LVDTTKFAPLYYLQQVDGVRPDLDIVLLGSEELYRADLGRRLASNQTVYLARYLPHLESYHLRSVGPLVEVGEEPLGSARDGTGGGPSASRDGLAEFGAGIQLIAADVERDPFGRPIHHVTLHWQAQTAVNEDLVVGLRLADADGQVVWAGDAQRPVSGLYPTNAWRVADPVSDYHEVRVPPWLPPGHYDLQVGLFAPFDQQGPPVNGGPTAWWTVQGLRVQPPSDPEPLPYTHTYRLGEGTWLVGLDIPTETATGAPLTVDLAWRRSGDLSRLRVWWQDIDEQQGHAVSFDLVEGMLRSRHTITTPVVPGAYTLLAGLPDQSAWCAWLSPPQAGCSIAEVGVRAGGEALANFGERILLLGADVQQRTPKPGDAIRVTLLWEGLRLMSEDYTVFVHLVGPDGRLYGQVDSWPVQGTYPTGRWTPSSEVEDQYQVGLERGAPAGRYTVAVGWYLLDTMQRLQVLNGRGEPMGDFFVVGTFEVQE
jgi:hypothetical protein